MENLQRTYFYAVVVLVLSEFSVEGGGFDKRFGWGEGEELQIFVFKPACKNDYEELRQGGERIMWKGSKFNTQLTVSLTTLFIDRN